MREFRFLQVQTLYGNLFIRGDMGIIIDNTFIGFYEKVNINQSYFRLNLVLIGYLLYNVIYFLCWIILQATHSYCLAGILYL